MQRDLIAINAAIKTMRASIGRAAPLVEEQDLANLRRRAERNVRREMPDLDLFYFAHLPEVDSETAQKFLDQLRLLRVVEVAYFQPIPFDTADIPPPTTIDVTPSQGYFRAAPAGIDVDFARNFSAGRGQGVRIADIEAGWHLGHEDLPRASFGFGVNWISGHGTAVLGQIAAEENGFGANGIVPLSIIGTSSVTNLDSFQGVYFYSVASALLMVGKVIRAGDIALIEQQFQHFGTRLVCDMATDPCKNCSIPPWVAEVMPEAEVTRTLSITVPTQPGTYNLSIVLRNGLGQALASSPVQQIVVAPNTLFDDARIAIITAPATLLSGQNNQVVIEVTNTGSTTWSTTAYSIGLQRGLRISLPQQSVALRSPVAPGGVQRLTFVISCNGPGQGWFEARMRGGTTGSFGSPAARTVICRGPVP